MRKWAAMKSHKLHVVKSVCFFFGGGCELRTCLKRFGVPQNGDILLMEETRRLPVEVGSLSRY